MAYNLENDIENIDRPMKSYKESNYNPFDVPVAGQSLTKEPGNAAWEHPPQIDSMEEAMGYVWEKLSQEQNYKRSIALLRFGMPIEALAKVISFSGFLEGKWTVDVAKMIEPSIGQMVATMGSTSKVPMKVSIGDKSDSQFIGAMAGNELDLDKAKVASEKSPELNMDELPKTNGLMSKGVA
tara:strand:+ start:476 stop:1021 length:546 start_codon:yes stop_codon:yes gene_type:complete